MTTEPGGPKQAGQDIPKQLRVTSTLCGVTSFWLKNRKLLFVLWLRVQGLSQEGAGSSS